jgi:formate dehydrogenase major subunit
MTNHWCDFKNADVIMTNGSNNLENHPISSKWVQRALDNGATWIVVDPRYSRTASQADIYCPIRSGTDIAFYGGLINYIIENDLWQHEYVLNYTNATYLINPDYSFDPETGLFSGWDSSTKKYSTTTWGYQTDYETTSSNFSSWVGGEGVPEFTPPTLKVPKKDATLTDPQCVFNIMKEHYSRYTMEKVCEVCGMDMESLEKVYSTYASTGDPAKSGAILYALGQTQHHYGSQNTRIMCMIQLLLGNTGMPGGGVDALRGEPNVQGATDMAMMVYDLPGYLHWPTLSSTPTLRDWCETETYSDGYYTNKPKFLVSFLKEWFGEYATADNDYCYDLLPKVPADGDKYTTIGTFELMRDDVMKGYFAWGQNPAASDPNASFVREALGHLDWLVSADWTHTATSDFWDAPGQDPADIQTECYILPAALIYEKAGTIVNSGRWLQWRYKAVDPVDEAKPDYEICDLLWTKIVELYQTEGGKNPDQILKTKWDYYVDGKIDPRPVAWALNGYTIDGTDFSEGKVKLLSGFSGLKADGTTANAIWIYGGFYSDSDTPLDPSTQPVGSRGHDDPGGLGLYPKWSYAWPANRRIIYNRASCDMEGQPWNPDKAPVSWNGTSWDTNDVPDFVASTTTDGVTTPVAPNNKAFMMKWEQNANLMTTGMKDAPLPEFYEPFESPTENQFNGSQNSPMIKYADDASVKQGDRDTYPIVATTYSITEHWQTGAQTRMCPVLDEIAPKQFIEMSEELAQERGISNNDDVRVFNNRGSVVVKAMVTKRLRPFTINGETVHEVGLIHHWDWTNDLSTGDVVNDLTPNVGDPNSYIPEFKAFLVDIEKA